MIDQRFSRQLDQSLRSIEVNHDTWWASVSFLPSHLGLKMYRLVSVDDGWRSISSLDNQGDVLDSLVALLPDCLLVKAAHELEQIAGCHHLANGWVGWHVGGWERQSLWVLLQIPIGCEACGLTLRSVHLGVIADDVRMFAIDIETVREQVGVVKSKHCHAAHGNKYRRLRVTAHLEHFDVLKADDFLEAIADSHHVARALRSKHLDLLVGDPGSPFTTLAAVSTSAVLLNTRDCLTASE